MTAPASVYPTSVADLLPLAREWASELDAVPSRNAVMRRFRIGDEKAKAILAALDSDTPDERIVESVAAPEEPRTAPEEPAAVPEPLPVPVIAPEQIPVQALPQAAVDVAPEPVITVAAAVKPRPVRSWPVFLIGLGAFVAIWAGWVELGKLTGFGIVHPLPGIADDFSINTAITLPFGMEAYAAYALKAWLSGSHTPRVARNFAKWSTVFALLIGMAGQIAYHLMVSAGITVAPWWITTAVSSLPVLVLGMAATLAHLLHSTDDAS